MSRSLERKIRDEPAELGGLAALEVRYGVPGEFFFLLFFNVLYGLLDPRLLYYKKKCSKI